MGPCREVVLFSMYYHYGNRKGITIVLFTECLLSEVPWSTVYTPTIACSTPSTLTYNVTYLTLSPSSSSRRSPSVFFPPKRGYCNTACQCRGRGLVESAVSADIVPLAFLRWEFCWGAKPPRLQYHSSFQRHVHVHVHVACI